MLDYHNVRERGFPLFKNQASSLPQTEESWELSNDGKKRAYARKPSLIVIVEGPIFLIDPYGHSPGKPKTLFVISIIKYNRDNLEEFFQTKISCCLPFDDRFSGFTSYAVSAFGLSCFKMCVWYRPLSCCRSNSLSVLFLCCSRTVSRRRDMHIHQKITFFDLWWHWMPALLATLEEVERPFRHKKPHQYIVSNVKVLPK